MVAKVRKDRFVAEKRDLRVSRAREDHSFNQVVDVVSLDISIPRNMETVCAKLTGKFVALKPNHSRLSNHCLVRRWGFCNYVYIVVGESINHLGMMGTELP